MFVIEQPLPAAPAANSEAQVLLEWNAVYDAYNGELLVLYLVMKGYVDQLECLGYVLPQDLIVGGKIQKANKKSLKVKGKGKANGKGKDKQVYIPKPKNPKPSAKEHPAKDDACHHCKEGFREARKLKQGALYLYVGNGVRAQVEAIGSFDLVLPNGLVICLDNCHYAPSILRGVVSVHRLSAKQHFKMVPTKKVDKTPYELWYGKVPNMSYLKETMGYYFYFPPENKIVVARYAEFFEKNLITQEVSGRAIDLEEIQDEDTSPSEITRRNSYGGSKKKREQFTIEERAKFIHDTIEAQRKFLAQKRVAAIRSKPPTKTQLRNQMMTYLKHVGNKKHSDLKNKTFKGIQALYERVKRYNDKFLATGSTEDARKCKEINDKAKDPEHRTYKRRVAKEVAKSKDIVVCRLAQLPSMQVRPFRTSLRSGGDEITYTIDYEVLETKSIISKLNKVSSPDEDYLVIYRANGNFRAFNYLLEVLHVFDRQDLFHLYDLVMEQYSEVTLEGIELILWGDLKILMESSTEENDQSDFWNDQQNWEIVRWRLYEACGVYVLELKDGIVIHMLVERRYPLSKDLL
ncbi:hypothetical protein Tco_0251434 [Tanacetum coccineum]